MKVKNNLKFQSLLMLRNINFQWYRYTFINHNVIHMNRDLISHKELSLYTEFFFILFMLFFCCKKKGFSWIFTFHFYLSHNVVGCVCIFCYQYKCNLIKWFLFFLSRPFVIPYFHIFIIYILLSFLIFFLVGCCLCGKRPLMQTRERKALPSCRVCVCVCVYVCLFYPNKKETK